jgi:hypothetical protein
MDVPVYKKLIDIENQKENPFNTPNGQEVVSVSESFWARLNREGRQRAGLARAVDVSGVNLNIDYFFYTFPGPIDALMYISKISISADVDAELFMRLESGLKDSGNTYHLGYCKAGTPFQTSFNGDAFMYEGGQCRLGIKTSTACKVWGSVYGTEVALNV